VNTFKISIPQLPNEPLQHYEIFIGGEVPEDIDFVAADTTQEIKTRMNMMLDQVHYGGVRNFNAISAWISEVISSRNDANTFKTTSEKARYSHLITPDKPINIDDLYKRVTEYNSKYYKINGVSNTY
jgi:hypothetical protein